MNTFIQRAMKAASKYTVLDFACLKIVLITFGILAGAYFSPFFLNHTGLLWIIFVLTYLWIMYKTFIVHWR